MGKDLKGNELGNGYRQRKDGFYEYRYTNRYGKRISVTGKTIQQCRGKVRFELKKDLESKPISTSNIKINDVFEKWYRAYSQSKVKAGTRRVYKGTYNKYIKPLYGNLKVKSCSYLQCTEIYVNFKQTVKSSALEKILSLLSSMFEMLELEGIVTKNYFKTFDYPKRQKSKRRALTDDEINLFFEYAKTFQYYHLYVLAINTGLRVGEITGLEINDIDFDNRLISINKQLRYDQTKETRGVNKYYFDDPKTVNSIRKVPLNNEAYNALKNYLDMRSVIKEKYLHKTKPDFYDLVFTTKYFSPINEINLNQMIKTIVDKINWYRTEENKIKYFTMHDLRITFATKCYYSGVDAKTLQSWLGHKNVSTTLEIYVKLDEEKARRQMNNVNITSSIHSKNDIVKDMLN